MLIFKRNIDLQKFLKNEKSVGFIPTLGALHSGHISLLAISKKNNNISGVSIFVNPTQFNNKKDFEKYPNTIENDIELLLKAKCDFLFMPSVTEMYPDGFDKLINVDLGYLNTVFEGAYRPGHYKGVCHIVHKLLTVVKPHNLYMGEKDFQQCMVVKKMIALTKLKVKLVICPSVRESDGLAMSSRNARLDKNARLDATTIYKCLKEIKANQKKYSFILLKNKSLETLQSKGFNTDYLVLANAENLKEMTDFVVNKNMIVLIATEIGGVRLIDNMRM